MFALERRVLIIGSEHESACFLKLKLEQTGRYMVYIQAQPQHALGAARAFAPDVIILDLDLAGVDGADVAATLARDPAARNVPVIFITALVESEETRPSGLVSGGRRFVPKPIEMTDLSTAIEESLAPRRQADAEGAQNWDAPLIPRWFVQREQAPCDGPGQRPFEVYGEDSGDRLGEIEAADYEEAQELAHRIWNGELAISAAPGFA
jgi:DNA-binding response OmpR family regulator